MENRIQLTGTVDLQSQKAVEAIRTVFEQLLCEMDYHEMTVKELYERAKWIRDGSPL